MKSNPEPTNQSFDGLESRIIGATKHFYCPNCIKWNGSRLEAIQKADNDQQQQKTDESKKELTFKIDSNSFKEKWKKDLERLSSEKFFKGLSKECEIQVAEINKEFENILLQKKIKAFRWFISENIKSKMEVVFGEESLEPFNKLEESFREICIESDKPFSSQLFQLSKEMKSIEAEVKTLQETLQTLKPDLSSLKSMLEAFDKDLKSGISDKKDQNLDILNKLWKDFEDWKKLFDLSLEFRMDLDLCKEKIDKLDFEKLFSSVKDAVASVKQVFSRTCKLSPEGETISPSIPHSTGNQIDRMSEPPTTDNETQSESMN